jgi:hypothetical protein
MAKANSFDQLIAQWDPKLQKAFLDSIANVRNRAQVNQIAAMLANDDVEGALKAVGLDPASFRPFDKTFESAFETGGVATADALPGFTAAFQFSIRNPSAEGWLRTYSSSMITDILDDQRTMIRNVLEAGLKIGANPKTTALDLVGRIGASGQREGGLIGLTDSQAEWVSNYRAELMSATPKDALARSLRDARFDPAVIRAAESGDAIPADLIDKMVKAYINRALRYRAETIARTESMTALHQAQEMAMQQAVGAGALSIDKVSYVWRATEDGRTRDAHRELDGQVAKMGVPFQSSLGPIRFPGDPLASLENTINCFHPSTMIAKAGLKGVISRHYSGELVKLIVAGGIDLSVTPNHPILTKRGWVAAGELIEGDYLVNCESVELISATQPEIQHGYASAESLCRLAKLGGSVDRAHRSTVNLHGEVPDHDIEIVSFPSKLRNAFKALGSETFGNIGLKDTDTLQGMLLTKRLCKHLPIAANTIETLILSVEGQLSALFGRHSRMTQYHGFGAASLRQSKIGNAGVYLAAANRQSIRYFDNRKAIVVKAFDCIMQLLAYGGAISLPGVALDLVYSFFGKTRQRQIVETGCNFEIAYAEPSADLGGRKTICVKPRNFGMKSNALFRPVRLLGIDRVHYEGSVLNFETDNGLILANGIVAHNCRCWREPKVNFLNGIK